jgi:hypothetical protein
MLMRISRCSLPIEGKSQRAEQRCCGQWHTIGLLQGTGTRNSITGVTGTWSVEW